MAKVGLPTIICPQTRRLVGQGIRLGHRVLLLPLAGVRVRKDRGRHLQGAIRSKAILTAAVVL